MRYLLPRTFKDCLRCLVALGSCAVKGARPYFSLRAVPLAEVLSRIDERANYGDTASGRFLSDELATEPFGWDFEAVRFFVLSLLRAGRIQVISKGQTSRPFSDWHRGARHRFPEQQLLSAGLIPPKERY